jgi:hypothetical protein
MAPLPNMHNVAKKPRQQAEHEASQAEQQPQAPRVAPEHAVRRSPRILKLLTMLLAVCVVVGWIFALILLAIHVL